MEILATLGLVALGSMFVGVLPLAMGIVYAIWPSEQRLMLMRPLSLATVFAGIAGLAAGVVNGLRNMGRAQDVAFTQPVVMGFADSFVPLFFAFGCLTVSWLCVTIGLSRRP